MSYSLTSMPWGLMNNDNNEYQNNIQSQQSNIQNIVEEIWSKYCTNVDLMNKE